MTKMIENEVNNFRTNLIGIAEDIIKRGMNECNWLAIEEYLFTLKTNMEYLERIIQVNIEEYKDKEIVPYSLYTRNNKLITLINNFREEKTGSLKGYMAILEECMKIMKLKENKLI